MRLGTTPTHVYTIPFDASKLKNFKVTYKQKGKIILKKYLDDFEINEKTLTIKLTQQETFLFTEGVDVEVQARALTDGEDALTSDIYLINVERCLDNEVLEE